MNSMNLKENTQRINEISDLLQNELNYELIWSGKDDKGKNFYRFNSERIKNTLVEAEKITNKLIKDNWVEHRVLDKKINNEL